MNITAQLWWLIPLVITVMSLIWALFIVKSGTKILAGINNIFALVPALIVSLVAWICGAACK